MVSKDELKKLAGLARVELPDSEIDSFRKDIESVLDYVRQIQEVAVGDISEQPQGVYGLMKNRMRTDENPHPGGEFSEEILNQAPQKEGRHFRVKKIL